MITTPQKQAGTIIQNMLNAFAASIALVIIGFFWIKHTCMDAQAGIGLFFYVLQSPVYVFWTWLIVWPCLEFCQRLRRASNHM